MNENTNTTSPDFWNDRWNSSHIMVIEKGDTYWGSNGVFLRVMKRHLGDINSSRIIEFGGANSLFLLALTKWENADVSAVDYSETGVEKLRSLFEANNCSINAVCADMFAWNPGENGYDLVLHWGLLEHFTDPVPVLRVCQSALAPAGKVVFSMPNMEAWGSTLWRRWSPENWALHIYHSDNVVENACASAGLQLIKKFYWGRPMLQRTLWERTGFLPKTVSIIQRSINLVNKIVPIYQYGSRWMSMERGFVAQHR